MHDRVTFGITAFRRPASLRRLVGSILRHYPLARIVVADNGDLPAQLPTAVKVIKLEFDCGLSRARNALFDQCDTQYLLILEDDFLFTDETRIEQLVEVLDHDPEVGVVGGSIRGLNGRLAAYSLDIEVFREQMYVRDSSHRIRFTPAGQPYRICDLIWNFALFRREMMMQHRWLDHLKVGEHAPYYHQVKLAARWRVACSPHVAIGHVSEPRTPEYLEYRTRAQSLFDGYLASQKLNGYHRVLPFQFVDHLEDKPCVIVLGVGHSGTSIITRMLHSLGWCRADADAQFAESISIRRLNMLVEARGRLPAARARAALASLPRPWVIKDPRFVYTLHHWLAFFQPMERKPALLRINRAFPDVLRSYQRRQAPGDLRQRLHVAMAMCRQQFEAWPWEKCTIEYERIAEAVALFKPTHSRPAESENSRRHMGESSPVVDSSQETRAQGWPVLDSTMQPLAAPDGSSLGQTLETFGPVLDESGFGFGPGKVTDSM